MFKLYDDDYLEDDDDGNVGDLDISGFTEQQSKQINKKIKQQLPWIEKYRPKTIDDIYLDTYTSIKMKKIIQDKNMPNIILTGMSGVGKTTTIKCIASGLYGIYADRVVLELNASDERGSKTADELIAGFCKLKYDIPKTTEKYAQHKLIILDEADNLTEKAQHLINKKMEEYHSSTRFAFTCNNSTGIISAIQSRCIILRYVNIKIEGT